MQIDSLASTNGLTLNTLLRHRGQKRGGISRSVFVNIRQSDEGKQTMSTARADVNRQQQFEDVKRRIHSKLVD